MGHSVSVEYLPGDLVTIDDSEIIGFVTEVSVCKDRICYRVEWMHNGVSHHDHFDGFRLNNAVKP